MPVIDIDADPAFEPITLRIEGKEYTVARVTDAMLDAMTAVAKRAQAQSAQPKDGQEGAGVDVVGEQLAVFFGVKPEEFAAVDSRKKLKAMRMVNQLLSDQMSGVEVPTGGAAGE